jgi:flagellar biosynthetic protein FliP
MVKKLIIMLFSTFVVLIPTGISFGQPGTPFVSPARPGDTSGTVAPVAGVPSIGDLMTVIDKATTDEEGEAKEWSTPVKLVIIFSGLAIVPSLLVMMTSFTRIVIVLAFVRRALTTQTIPPTVAIIGLALFLTLYTMAPTFAKANASSIQPYLADEIDFQTAAARFRTAFEMGCLLFIPFLLVDMVIASVLLSAGMMMLPPVMISLPFKLMLFILVDGWGLLARSLSLSFR